MSFFLYFIDSPIEKIIHSQGHTKDPDIRQSCSSDSNSNSTVTVNERSEDDNTTSDVISKDTQFTCF